MPCIIKVYKYIHRAQYENLDNDTVDKVEFYITCTIVYIYIYTYIKYIYIYIYILRIVTVVFVNIYIQIIIVVSLTHILLASV